MTEPDAENGSSLRGSDAGLTSAANPDAPVRSQHTPAIADALLIGASRNRAARGHGADTGKVSGA